MFELVMNKTCQWSSTTAFSWSILFKRNTPIFPEQQRYDREFHIILICTSGESFSTQEICSNRVWQRRSTQCCTFADSSRSSLSVSETWCREPSPSSIKKHASVSKIIKMNCGPAWRLIRTIKKWSHWAPQCSYQFHLKTQYTLYLLNQPIDLQLLLPFMHLFFLLGKFQLKLHLLFVFLLLLKRVYVWPFLLFLLRFSFLKCHCFLSMRPFK